LSDFTLADIIESLPAFVTTNAYSEQAVLRLPECDAVKLKQRYQAVFADEWAARQREAAEYGFVKARVEGYVGENSLVEPRDWGTVGRGGLRIVFEDAAGEDVAAIWWRQSGTEPLVRVAADVAGNDAAKEQQLLEWQRDMLLRAVGTR
jgi:phosphoglucomutase